MTEVIILPKVFYVWDFPIYCTVRHPSSTGAQELLADCLYELLKDSGMSDVCFVKRNYIILPVKAMLLSLAYLDVRCVERAK